MWQCMFHHFTLSLNRKACGNESYEKETKHNHASAADLQYICCKCGHFKNEAVEIDCLCCREVDAMLIVSAKIPEREGGISPSSFYGHLPGLLVTRVSLIYLVVGFFCFWCCWTKWGGWVNLKFYLFISGVNQVEWKREVNPRFPFVNLGVWDPLLTPTASKVA